jgi:hypothetical protein
MQLVKCFTDDVYLNEMDEGKMVGLHPKTLFDHYESEVDADTWMNHPAEYY